MLNREKFAKEILDIACNGDGFGLCDGKLVACGDIVCTKCEFNSVSYSCNERTREWANSEYVEPPVDWSKIPVDTPILVRDSKNASWEKKYFSEYRNGTVYAWADGATSWSVEKPEYVYDWKYAKLAESEESHD